MNCLFRTLNIYDNILSRFSDIGIDVSDNHYADIFIERNLLNDQLTDFYLAPEARVGIWVRNTIKSKPALTIKENHIYNARNAIQLMNQDKGFITANIIYYLVPNPEILSQVVYRNGIIAQNCNTVEVSYNEIYRTCATCSLVIPDMHGYLRGISVDMSWCRVHENYVKDLPTASRVFDNCNGTDFFCNNYEHCSQGYVWDLNASILDQGAPNFPTNNVWTNWFGSFRIERIPGVPLALVPWYYDPSANPPADYNPTPWMTDVIFPFVGSNNENCYAIHSGGGGHQGRLMQIIEEDEYAQNYDENKFHDYQNSYQQLKDDLQLLYSGTTYDADLQNFFSLMALNNIGALDNVRIYLNDNDKATALLANGSISPENVMEANSKYVNNICINSLGDTITYDSLQRSQLIAIAYQLPIIGGEAVYRARAILKLDVDHTQLQYRFSENDQNHSNEFALYPNPNKGTFMVNYRLEDNEKARIIIQNSIGQTIETRDLSTDLYNTSFSLSETGVGVYTVRLLVSSGRTRCWRVAVIK